MSGLFARLSEVTVRGWYEAGSLTKLTAGALEALKRGTAFYKPVSSGHRALLNVTKEKMVKLLRGLRTSGVASILNVRKRLHMTW